MRRVVILGNSGTGKSTFARKLGERRLAGLTAPVRRLRGDAEIAAFLADVAT